MMDEVRMLTEVAFGVLMPETKFAESPVLDNNCTEDIFV